MKVCVAFDTVEFKIAGEGEEPSTVVTVDPAETINLLDFQGMNAAPLLIDQELTAGDYEWIRLGVDADLGNNGGMGDTDGVMCDGAGSYIKMSDGGVYNLYIPSGAETGLKLVSGFTVPVNGSADFTVEFDLMKSITAPPGLSPNVILRPALRLVNDVDAGALTGSVASDLATAECMRTVSLCVRRWCDAECDRRWRTGRPERPGRNGNRQRDHGSQRANGIHLHGRLPACRGL
ncbi:MAG: DUF4382 domain-containing protein [Woeseiaceae bacterium]|nr:DUF4382 domain-containing protein [Woeseiaceae bacterium]